MFFCVVLLSVLLSVSHQCLPSAPALDPAPHLCPACPPALRDHPDLGALPPPHPFSSSSPPALAFIHTFLLSCPSPRAPACSGREGSRTLFPLFKVSRLVSQEGGLSLPSCLPPLPGAMGEGAIPGGPRPLLGERAAETWLWGGHLAWQRMCPCVHVCACELVCASKHVCMYMCVLAAKLRVVGAGQWEEEATLCRGTWRPGEMGQEQGAFLMGDSPCSSIS